VRVLPPGALSLEQMRQRVAALPPNSAVVYGMFAVGTDGAQHENELALVAISGASSAPIFGIYASLGLASMRERVRLLQGELDIESTPGRGTTVVAWVPA
jgi:hypothetical protein